MILRELVLSDYYKGYYDLIKQLSVIDDTSYENFELIFNKCKKNKYHFIYILEDNNRIIASITLLLEPKFSCDFISYIEDLVIDKEYRNKGLEKKLKKKFF